MKLVEVRSLLMRIFAKPRIRVLVYHSVGMYPEDPYSVGPETLNSHLDALNRHATPIMSITSALDLANKAHNGVLLTFDDAYHDFYLHALPCLQRFHMAATVFVVSRRVGEKSDWSSRDATRSLMTWAELRECHQAGIDIQSHTVTHPDLTMLNENDLEYELTQAQHDIEREIGCQPLTIAYPFGFVNERVVQSVSSYYDMAFGLGGLWGLSKNIDRFRVPRYMITKRTSASDIGDIVSGRMDVRIAIAAMRHRTRNGA